MCDASVLLGSELCSGYRSVELVLKDGVEPFRFDTRTFRPRDTERWGGGKKILGREGVGGAKRA